MALPFAEAKIFGGFTIERRGGRIGASFASVGNLRRSNRVFEQLLRPRALDSECTALLTYDGVYPPCALAKANIGPENLTFSNDDG